MILKAVFLQQGSRFFNSALARKTENGLRLGVGSRFEMWRMGNPH